VGKGRRRPFRTCGCGATYTFGEWRLLERIGFLDTESELQALDEPYVPPPPEEVVPPFEMRNCAACGSTISVLIPYPGGSDYPVYARGKPMRYCRECKEAGEPRKDCPACADERGVQVATLAREIFVRTVARKSARIAANVTYKDHAVEAFVASDDFLGVAEQWVDEGRDKVLSRRPERAARDPKKKPQT
jgi:hypothetical protein